MEKSLSVEQDLSSHTGEQSVDTCTHPHTSVPTCTDSNLELRQPLDGLEGPQDTQDSQRLDGIDVFPFGSSRREKWLMLAGRVLVLRPALTSPLGLSNKTLCFLSQAPDRGSVGEVFPWLPENRARASAKPEQHSW